MEYPKKLKIITTATHNKELRQKSRIVTKDEIIKPEFQEFVAELKEAMINAPLPKDWVAAGISAIQVNVPIRVFWAFNSNHKEYILYINPEIELRGDAKDINTESCLSVDGVEADVRRYKRIKVTYQDIYGDTHSKQLTGMTARIIQHEYDHLEGLLFVDICEKK